MVTAILASRASLERTPALLRAPQRSVGTWVILGVPILLGLVFVWQLASNMLQTQIGVRRAVSISRVSLEPDPLGSRIDLVVVDRMGLETTFTGEITVQLREPDGMVWQTTRSLRGDDFGALEQGGLLAGRVGYSVVVPSADWLRAPRRGGAATVSVSVVPTNGAAFSTIAEERFP